MDARMKSHATSRSVHALARYSPGETRLERRPGRNARDYEVR